MLGISWFWFYGAMFLSQFPNFTKDVLGGGEHVVTLLLAVFSIFAWALMMGKYSELKKLRELNFAFERRLGEQRHILDLPENRDAGTA